MAPSQMEHHQQEQSLGHGYTHKKFNCGYSHKKLGMRLRQREEIQRQNKENIASQQETSPKATNTSTKGLFRPYALGDDTPRKRKFSRDSASESSDEEINSARQSSSSPSTPTSTPPTACTYYQPQQPIMAEVPSMINCPSPALSPNSYAQRLQRQRAALYMRYMQQFHAGGLNNSITSTSSASSLAAAAPLPMNLAYHHPMGYPNVTAPIFNGC
uniref:Uncharacterized protein n=1 Tax=Stomoxys calcitrans TaxID=35570 RepID=A0A1I8PCW3_STOCA